MAVVNAINGRNKANGIPNNDAVARIESAPVWGVDIRNEVVAPFDTPSRRSDIAVGITPQEHKGRGMPISAAKMTERRLLCDRLLRYNLCGTNSCKIPAMRKPNSRYGDISLSSSNSGKI